MSAARTRPTTVPGADPLAVAHRIGAGAIGAVRRLRCRALVAQVHALARWRRSQVTVSVADDVRLGRRVRVVVEPGTTAALHIGPGCRIGDDVRIEIGNGTLVLGPGVDLRARATLFVHGRLTLDGANVLQHGCSFHCDEAITIGRRAVLSDHCTVVDSSHTFDGPSDWFLHDLRTAPVTIGADAWLGVKATVTRGVTVGERAVIGANSVVVSEVPPGWLASGVPARNLRPFTAPRTTGDPHLTGDPHPTGDGADRQAPSSRSYSSST